MRWTLIRDGDPHPGWFNMALDEALLDESVRRQAGFLRLYRWQPHCLSFGRHEPALRRYHRDHIEALGIDVVRRPTGGRAVWHAGELTYAVTAPEDTFGTLRDAYRSIHQAIRLALGRLGAEATLAGTPDRPVGVDAGACFAQPVGGEVLVGTRKVVGSAQVRRNGGFLQHGSILLDDDQSFLADITRGEAPRGNEAPLNRILASPVSFSEVASAVYQAARTWRGEWDAEDRGTTTDHVAQSRFDHYRSTEWTWRR